MLRRFPRGKWHYPRNWGKVRRTLRRVVGHCEQCGTTEELTIHHRGIPFANGRSNHPSNKHDLRRENLQVLCQDCHTEIERRRNLQLYYHQRKMAWKRTALERLGVGTGLVPYDPAFHHSIVHNGGEVMRLEPMPVQSILVVVQLAVKEQVHNG